MKRSENKKAHFLCFGDKGLEGGGNFVIISRRQNMSFCFFASIPNYVGLYRNNMSYAFNSLSFVLISWHEIFNL